MPPQIADNDDTPSLAEWLRQIPGVYPWLYEQAGNGGVIARQSVSNVPADGADVLSSFHSTANSSARKHDLGA